MDEQQTLEENVLQNVANASERMNEDDENRYKESQVYIQTVRAANEIQNKHAEMDLAWAKHEFEKERFEREQAHREKMDELDRKNRLEVDKMNAEIQAKKDQHDNIMDYVGAGLEVGGLGATLYMGLLTLKHNLDMGGVVGDKAREWLRKVPSFKRLRNKNK